MSNKCVALKAPIVIQQPAIVLQAPSTPEASPTVGEETNSSTQAEASESQQIELNCREQDRSESHQPESDSKEQRPVELSGTQSTLTDPVPVQTTCPLPSPKIDTPVPPDATHLEEESPSQTRQSPEQNLTPGQPSDPRIPGANVSGDSTKPGVAENSVVQITENKPVRNTVERRILVRTVNAPVMDRTAPSVPVKVETGDTRPKIKIQANQLLIRDNRPKIRVAVGDSQSIVCRNVMQSQNIQTETRKNFPTLNTASRLKPGVRPGNTQDVSKSMNDIFGRREDARLKRRAERQAKLRAEAMSASKNNPPVPPILPIPNTLPMSSAKTMMSSLELIGLMSPDVSLTQRVALDVQRTPVQPSPSSLGTETQTPTDNTRSPVSDKSHSGFMSVPSMTVKPGSFMHFAKDVPTPDSMSRTEPIEELEPEHIDLSESDPEPMEDTPEESDKMEADKSSCRDTSPSLSSRTATATASPSRSSSYTASRGSRSGSWTKSSSQSIQSQRSRSRSRSHNSTTSSTTPTRERKPRRRRPRQTPSSPSMQSLSVSRSPTPTQNPRLSTKRKKGKVASDSPVPRKYKNSSTDEFDPDYAPFTEVPPEVRNTDAFCYFGNPVVKERERTPQSYSRPHSHSDRYTHSRPSSSRYPRSSYSQQSHTTHGHVYSHEHTSQRTSSGYRGNSYAPQGGRSRYNHSSNYNTSPHKTYNSYPPHKSTYNYSQSRGNYNNYSPHPRGSYSSQQRSSYNPSRGGYPNQYHQKESYPQKRPSKYESDSGKPQKTDNSGFGAFYRKDDDQWAEKDHDRRKHRDESPSSSRTVSARLADRLGPLPHMHYQKSESGYWKGDRGHEYQDRNVFKRWRTSSHSNSDEEYKLNLKIKDIIAKNEQILRRKIELEEDKMIHGVS